MSQEIVDTYRKEVQYRVRHDRIDKTGTVTLRYRSWLRHIRIGAAQRTLACP